MFGIPCPGCARQVRIDADACWGCGRPVTAEERAAEHARRVRRARWWVAFVAIMFAASGLVGFAMRKTAVDEAVARINLGVNIGLAALFGVFWLWSRRAPAAALASAIGLLLGVWIVVGAIDRSTLLDGYVIKLAALVIFAAGLRAALAARRAALVGDVRS